MNKNNLKGIQTIFRALLMGQAIFLGAAIFLKSRNMMADVDKDTERILQVIALVVSLSFVWTGFKLFRKKTEAVRQSTAALSEKMAQYRSAALVQWALTEGACLFSIVGYLLTGNYAFIGLAAVLLFVFAGYYPIKARVVQQLSLNDEEAAEL